MSCTIRRVYLAELSGAPLGRTVLYADTLDGLDHAVEAHLSKIQETKVAKATALLARIAGRQRAAYAEARKQAAD